MEKKRSWRNFSAERRAIAIDLLVLAMIWLFLLTYFKPELLFSPTTTSGGDTGSHNYLQKYMAENLAQGKILGYSHDWYGGLPMFQFYFPLAYMLMAVMSVVINANVAFKLISVMGSFIMPVCAYFMFRIFGFKFPAPAIAAIFTLPFLFLQSNSMYGGNIPSTLAGEFSFSISIALSLVFLASLYMGIKTKKMMVLNVILLGVIALFHIIPIITIALSSIFFLRRDKKSNFRYLLYVYLGAFLLVGFWSIPFLAKAGYTTSTAFTAFRDMKDVLPEGFSVMFALTIIGAIAAFRKKDQRIIYLAVVLGVAFALFALMPTGHVWNTRFLPWYYLMAAMIGAYGAYELLANVRPQILMPIIVFLIVAILLNTYVTFIGSWINWNYSGFENKPQWATFDQTNQYLSSLPPGKVLHEYSNKHDAMFGTPRALELIPYFTNKPGMEGLLIESSASSPYYFYLQSEVSETPTCPISTFRCTSFNIDGAYDRMELFNVKYVVATTDKLKNALQNNTKFTFLRKIGDLWVYEVHRDNAYVATMNYQPVIADGGEWHRLSSDWIRSENSDVTIIYADLPYQKISDVNEIQKIPEEPCTVSDERVSNEEITFSTDCIGKPLLVKATYSPNWQADGGKVYLASPSFFVVVPEQSNVRLHYSNTIIDWIAIVSSLAMVFVLLNIRFNWVKLPNIKYL